MTQQAPTQDQLLAEAQRRGLLQPSAPTREQLLQEATKRGLVSPGEAQPLISPQELSVLQQQLGGQEGIEQAASETGAGEAFLASVGRQFAKTGRTIERGLATRSRGGVLTEQSEQDLADIEARRLEEQRAFAPLEEQRPISTTAGDITGAIAATAPVGGPAAGITSKAVGVLSPKLAPVLGFAAAGAIEETLLEGNPLLGASFGAAGGVLLPVVGRAFKAAAAKLTGRAADEFSEIPEEIIIQLQQEGIDVKDLGTAAEQILRQNFDEALQPAAQARQARAGEFGAELTSAQASKDFAQQELEDLTKKSGTEQGRQVLNILSEQQQSFIEGAEDKLLNPFGSTLTTDVADKFQSFNKSEAGRIIRDSLKEIKTRDKTIVSNLYKAAEEISGDQVPLNGIDLAQTFLTRSDFSGVSDTTKNAMLKNLAKFGVIGKEPKIIPKTAAGGSVSTENIKGKKSLESFTRAVNEAKTAGANSFTSGSKVSLSEVKFWNSLKEQGLPVVKSKNILLSGGGKNAFLKTSDGSSDPIFTIDLSQVKQPKVSKRRTSVDVDGKPIKVEGGINTLTVDNAEELRKRINAISVSNASDTSFKMSMLDALDNSFGEAIEKIPQGEAKKEAFEGARNAFSAWKNQFDVGDDITKILTFKDAQGNVPVIPDEEILNKFIIGSNRVQNTKRLRQALLRDPTAGSRQAWKDVQTIAMEDFLKKSMGRTTDASGNVVNVFSGDKLTTALEKMGAEHAKILFGPEMAATLKRFTQAVGDATIPIKGAVNPSESGTRVANVMRNFLAQLGNVVRTGGGLRAEATRAIAKGKAEKAAIEQLEQGLQSAKGQSLPKVQVEETILDWINSLGNAAADTAQSTQIPAITGATLAPQEQ
jgi:hypothetical protein